MVINIFSISKCKKTINLVGILILLTIFEIFKSECFEQWNQLKMSTINNMTLIQSVKATDHNSLFFYKDPNDNAEMDVTGIAWLNPVISKKNGLKISFNPSIITDINYYGLQKYPQGFAFILTSNPVDKTIGEKRSGLGFEGIYNSIAFFFDFITNPDKLDANFPHFSITYNLNGQIKSICENPKLCNIKIPNFYDNEMDDFITNMKISIELYNGQVKVFFNEKTPAIIRDLPEFGYIMDNDIVHFGVSSSMTLYKGVKIQDLQLMTIVSSETPFFELENSQNFIAGSTLTLYLFKKTSCSTKLNIFTSEQKLLKLRINDDEIFEPLEINFNHDRSVFGLETSLRNVEKEGITRITAYWAGKPIKTNFLNVVPAKSLKFDICNPKYDPVTNVLLKNGTTSDKFYTFDICVTDLYRNSKSYDFSYLDDLIKLEYPFNIIPEQEIKYSSNKEKSVFTISVPTTSKGVYKIYNPYFFNENIKSFTINSGKPDLKKSYGEIKDYLENKVTQAGKVIHLGLFIRDALGNTISNEEFKNLKCSFQKSVVIQDFQKTKTEKPLGEYDILDGILDLNFSPNNPGEYTFVPKLQCGAETEAYEIVCTECTFFVSTSSVDNTKFQIYSDFYEKYVLTSELNQSNQLKISMDEEKNFKLTSILILDTSGVPIFVSNLDKTIADALNSFNVEINYGQSKTKISNVSFKINPAGGIDIFMDNQTDRTKVFSSLEKYNLVFSLNNASFKINETTIPLVFSYRDDFLNNISNQDLPEAPENFYAVYRAETYELRATSNQFLFRIIAKNTQNQISYGKTLDCSKVVVEAYFNGKSDLYDIKHKCQANDMFLNISGSFLKSGYYNIKLFYNKKQLYEITKLKINPRPDVVDLTFDTKNSLINNFDSQKNKITLTSQPVGQIFSFEFSMVDEYGNVINEKLIQSMNQIKIENKGNGQVTQLFDGRILVTGEENIVGDYSVIFTLSNNKTFTLNWKRISEKMDPYHSGSDMLLFEKDGKNYLEVNFYAYDQFNKNLIKEVLENKTFQNEIIQKLQIYALNPKNKIVHFEFDTLKSENKYNILRFTSKENVVTVGEYELITFYDNIPISCQICFAKLNPIKIDEKTVVKTEIYYTGYKHNSKFYQNDKYHSLTGTKNIPIFAIFKDVNGNEISNYNQKIDLGVYSEATNKEIARFCHKNFDYKTRQYLEICKEYLNDLERIEDGNYYIATTPTSETKYKFTVQKKLDENSSIPSVKYSLIKSDEELIIGFIDTPARIIVDFRNERNQRYENLDLTKITLKASFDETLFDMKNDKMKIFYGPMKGLITILFYNDKIITEEEKATVTILYDKVPIISDSNIIFESGRIAKIELLDKDTKFSSNSRFNIFRVLDMNNNPIKDLAFKKNNYLFNNLITIKDTNKKAFYNPNLYHNALTGTLSLSLDLSILNELEINSPFIATPIKIPSIPLTLDFTKSFVYLDNINDGKVGDDITLKVQLLDTQMNYVPNTQDMSSIADKFTVMILKNYNNEIEFIETIKFNKDFTNEKNGIVLNKKATLSGDYFFIPFFNNIPIKCTYCRKIISSGSSYDLNLTSLKIKSGLKWEEKSKTTFYNIYKKNLPVFKIYLKDSTGTIINTPISNLSANIVNEKGDISIPMILYLKNTDGIYAYLDENGRNKLIGLEISNKVSLKIFKTNDPTTSIVFENFILLNSDIPQNRKVQCPNETVANFFEKEETYIVTAGKEAYIEFHLLGCENDENSLNDNNEDFLITVCTKDNSKCSPISLKENWYYKIIPSDGFGKYILLIGSNLAAENLNINIKYKNFSASENLNLNIISDNKISSIFYTDKNYEIRNGFVFLKLKIQDSYGNIIKRDSTNIYLRDIFVDIIDSQNKKIAYDLTYKSDSDEFYVKLLSSEDNNYKINIPNSKQDSIAISIKDENDSLINSVFTFEKFIYPENSLSPNAISLKIEYKNGMFETIATNEKLKNLMFRFDSVDSTTDEVFTIISDNISYEAESMIVKFYSNLKLLQFSNIQPLAYNFDEIACTNCLITNKSLDYIYISSTKNDRNDCFIVPFVKFHLLKGSRDKIFAWYEGTGNDIKLTSEDKTKEIKISTVSKQIGNGLIQTFIGFDLPNNDLKEINYNLIVTNANNDTKTLKILNSKDNNSSNEKVNLNNVVISGLKGSRFFAGQIQYFFIELRDSNHNLIRTPTTISTKKDIKLNIINTAYEGLYLVEYTVEEIPVMKSFKLKIDQEELNVPIHLNVVPDYPVKMDSVSIHSREIIHDRNVRYQVSVYDKFGNTVCDERLNFEVINQENMNDFYLSYDQKADICYSEFLFYGKSVLISPLLGDIQLNLENLKEIHLSNLISYVNLKSNNYKKDEVISINPSIYDEYGKFISPEGLQMNLRFLIYFIYNNNQRILVKDLSTASISTDIDTKNFKNYGNYLIKTIVNGIEFTIYTYFKLNRNDSKDVSGIQLKIKRNNLWLNIDNIYNNINTPDEIQNSISYPYTLLMSLVNADNIKIPIPTDTVIEASLITADPSLNSGQEKLLDLEGIPNSHTSYLITEPKLFSNLIFHLPKGKYYIRINITSSVSSKITRFIPFQVEKGLYQNDNFDYHLPTTNLGESFKIVAMDGMNTIYTNIGSYSTANICFKFNEKILNQYLDPKLFKVENLNNSNCSTYAGAFYRGCIQFSIMCSALNNGISEIKAKVVYNNSTTLSNEMPIFIDPSLPPAKFVINSKFPETTEQMVSIHSVFKVLDKDNKEFKHLNTENFEIYDNNKKIAKKYWKLITNIGDGADLQIDLAYPPKSHNIKVLFKNSNGLFRNIPDLNSVIQVTQGVVDPIKTSIGIPIYYRSGDALELPILFRDKNGNCFEDKVDVNLLKIKISKDNESFENFKFTEEKYETEICSKYILAKATDFSLKKVGSYKLQFSYNSTAYALPFNKLYISSNNISPKTSTISVRGKEVLDSVDVKTGEKFDILIKGTDINGNQVEYGELIEKLKVKIGKLEEDKDFKVYYTSDSNYMIITINIFKPDIYDLEILLDKEVFNSEKGLKRLNVKRGDCDRLYPNIKLDKEKFFVGEFAELRVHCRDSYNNTVDSINEKDFSLKIIGEKLNGIETDILPYTLSAKQDILTSSFLFLYTGMYDITVHLKGAQYGNVTRIEVIREKCAESTPYMCSNRKCVAKPSECPDLVDEHCTDPEKPFYCRTGEQKGCVAKLEECKCKSDQTECKGMCIPNTLRNFCTDKPSVDCSHIKGATACFDGTCKIGANCGNDLACPLGYKMCGAKCILKTEQCIFEPVKCKDSEVTCWDYSCANKYENCPTRKVCDNDKDRVCPDGTCVSNGEKCPQPKECRSPFNFLCPDFTCRKSEKECPRKIVCEPGMSLCENNQCAFDCKNQKRKCPADQFECKSGICVDYQQLCPSEVACLENQIRCENGACARSIEECKFLKAENKIICPDKTPILCADLTCVDDIEKCRVSLINSIKCPANLPFRCPNNECRKEFRECPTTTTCPESFPILCSDGSCQKASYHCKVLEYDNNQKATKVLCSDGSFAVSLSLCPTQITCNEGMIKCWNGACAFSLKECLYPKYADCPAEFPFRCIDGSCRISKTDCSSETPCPVFKPIKCLDGSCRESLDLCPKVNPCPSNFVACPNGTCAPADKCSTEITCLSSKPFLCPNKKCVKDYRECEKVDECSKGFLCPDGECVSNRLDCLYSAPCDSKNPVRCDNRSCAQNADACNATPNQCPIGYIKCKSGVCKANEDLCKEEICAPHTPFKCSNGECAVSEDLCDKSNGCPASYPNKCVDGSCKKTEEECKTLEKEVTNKIKAEVESKYKDLKDKLIKKYENDQIKSDNEFEIEIKKIQGTPEEIQDQIEKMKLQKARLDEERKAQKEEEERRLDNERQIESQIKLCPDGSKITGKVSDCPSQNGCPKDLSFRCSDGTCAKELKECFSAKCSFEKPIKCANGVCVKFASDCALLSTIKDDYEACSKIGLQGYFMCADGVCVKSPEYCKPLYDCPAELSKCDDGTCRVSEFCPKVIEPCPENRPIKCNDGRCIDSFGNCNSFNNICLGPNSNRCPNGLCINNSTLCEDVKFSTQSTCEFTKVDKETSVKILGFKCYDGRCMESEDQCYSVDLACNVENPVLCQDGVCRKSFKECEEVKLTGCNTQDEVACPNKVCVRKQDYFTACKNKLGCPLVKPIRCSNGECAASYTDCASTYKCPILKPFRCADLRCVEDLNFCNTHNNCKEDQCKENGLCVHMGLECKNFKNLCPLLAPVRCPNGLCVANVNECENSFYKEECKEGEFFCLIKGECLLNKSDCIGEEYARGGVPATTRLLQSDSIENNCSFDYPYSCFDGTCRKNREECTLPNACLASEFKCADGTCAKDSKKCKEKLILECKGDLIRCNDGLCRKTCPEFNGCDAANPYQCSNGRCVRNKLECLGYSICPENQYRCVNGECKMDPNECNDIKRLYSPIEQSISISQFDGLEADLVFDKSRKPIVSLHIPANSFNIKNGIPYSSIQIKPVAHSYLRSLSYSYNKTETFMFKIANAIKDSDGELTFDNSVVSPIVNITCAGCENQFFNPGLLRIEHNYHPSIELGHENYCLAKLIDNKWRCYDEVYSTNKTLSEKQIKSNCTTGGTENIKCSSRKTFEEQTSFTIDSFGVYAVVIIPVNSKTTKGAKDNIIFNNLKLVIISSVITAAVVLILYIIFVRILRYRKKYITNKKRIENIKSGVANMMNMNLAFPGATIGDAINQINFEPNPCFKIKHINKDPIKEKEDEIDRLTSKFTSMEKNNEELISELERLREEYNELRRIVDKMKKT